MPEGGRHERWRLFVAVPLHEELREALETALAPLRGEVRARWARAEGLHVTLCFLGDVPAAEVPPLARRAADIVAPFPPFIASVGATAAFGRGRRPRTAWLGVNRGAQELADLVDAVTVGLLGEVRPDRRPHLTLARDVAAGDLSRVADAVSALAGAEWLVDAAYLYRSRLGPGGSRYEALAELPLRGGNGTR